MVTQSLITLNGFHCSLYTKDLYLVSTIKPQRYINKIECTEINKCINTTFFNDFEKKKIRNVTPIFGFFVDLLFAVLLFAILSRSVTTV